MFDEQSKRTMEDLFFFQHEQRMQAARKELEARKETKENLAKVSGIRNDVLLDKLLGLDIRPETLATLFVIPLVEVAWADGEVQEAERAEILRYAEKAGLKNKAINPVVFTAWLKKRPDSALMDAWRHYIQTLCRELNDEERRTLMNDVLTDARAVAEAAGGFLGFGAQSAAEQRVLEKVEAAFG